MQLQKYNTFLSKKSQKTVDFRLKPPYNSNTMKRTTITIKLERSKRRCVELYSANTPFKGRVEQSRVAYKRHAKNQKEVDKALDQ
jgi:hypothetical protein